MDFSSVEPVNSVQHCGGAVQEKPRSTEYAGASREELLRIILQLEDVVQEQKKNIEVLEGDRSSLRANIRKASASWFERKAKVSESENEQVTCTPPSSPSIKIEVAVQTSPSDATKTEELNRLLRKIKLKDEELGLSEKRCFDLNKKLKDYENVIDDQEKIIDGLKDQLHTYFCDNQNMSRQLADLNNLFQELESVYNQEAKVPDIPAAEPTSNQNEDLSGLTGSISRTYLKLKELIYEKKSLLVEIERLQTLNVELQRRVAQQEMRLTSVSDALHNTWLLVSNLKEEHAKIHTAESILRYELKEKRDILQRLKEELENYREQWHIIRQKNSESEQEWHNLKAEFAERRRRASENSGSAAHELEGAVGGVKSAKDFPFEPPVDLLLDMGIECGIIDIEDEESSTGLAILGGEDVHAQRLLNLEDQCCHLYSKLMASTARSLALASRLTSLHQRYGSDDEDEDEDEEEGENEEMEEYYHEEYGTHLFDSPVQSPDSESYDTAYVSEGDGAESSTPIRNTETGESGSDNHEHRNHSPTPDTNESSDTTEEDTGDALSRRLINFLPRKIELLSTENKRLLERLTSLQEEKNQLEATMNTTLETEKKLRRQAEEKLGHLGKCVDELKLERNGQIADLEDELKKQMEQIREEAAQQEQLREELELLKEKFEERGQLLQVSALQIEQSERKVREAQDAAEELEKQVQVLTSSSLHNADNMLRLASVSHNDKTHCAVQYYHELPQSRVLVCREGDSEGSVASDFLLHYSPMQFDEVELKAGSSITLSSWLQQKLVLCFALRVDPQSIYLSIKFQGKARKGKDYRGSEEDSHLDGASYEPLEVTHILHPTAIHATSQFVHGQIEAKKDGTYTIVVHNQSQRFDKRLEYRLWGQKVLTP